ncbi:MAG: UDP-2,3-diacylglucosamine diphosphatase, partial [Pseudomonadota bacterium]
MIDDYGSEPHTDHYRALHGASAFISDMHLGTKGCRGAALVQFLRHLDVDNLYLVGDIIDLQRMAQSMNWSDSHTQAMREIFRLAASGVNVTYIPGNHDAHLRAFAGTEFGGVKIRLNTIHTTRDGRRLLVTHGDQFDGQLRIGSLKERFGSAAYQWLLDMDAGINRVRQRLGYQQVSVTASLKMRFDSARQYIREFERTAANDARKRGLDGIVCGHIHKPAIMTIDGVGYFNDGDWVEHGTALMERNDGMLELTKW